MNMKNLYLDYVTMGHVARMRREMRTKFWSENLKGRGHVEDIGVHGKIILK
jgi:hypothetical protein